MKKIFAALVLMFTLSAMAVPCERELYDAATGALLTHYPQRTAVVQNGIIEDEFEIGTYLVYLFTVDTEDKHFTSWKVELASEITCETGAIKEFND